eukprot:TRINITY_DN2774_c0_g1_i1.p1 TRINITY_DN2774_c0_g1~~TRINITY_DN2774_c0_g1_i1.p1  ORF type:complete len:410 (+),score=100.58 TRINITY_DN2774_c0_g1_i1:96-1325(+)
MRVEAGPVPPADGLLQLVLHRAGVHTERVLVAGRPGGVLGVRRPHRVYGRVRDWCVFGVVFAVVALLGFALLAVLIFLCRDTDGGAAEAEFNARKYRTPLIEDRAEPWGQPVDRAVPDAGPWELLRGAAVAVDVQVPDGAELGFDYVTVPAGEDGELVLISALTPPDGAFARAGVPLGGLVGFDGQPVTSAQSLLDAAAAFRSSRRPHLVVEVVPERSVRASRRLLPTAPPPMPPPPPPVLTPAAPSAPDAVETPATVLRTPPPALPAVSAPARTPASPRPQFWSPQSGVEVSTLPAPADGQEYSGAQKAHRGEQAVVAKVLPVGSGSSVRVQLRFRSGERLVWRWCDCVCVKHDLHPLTGGPTVCGVCDCVAGGAGDVQCSVCGFAAHQACAGELVRSGLARSKVEWV